MGSSASATYLCVRNLVGGIGPLAVAGLIGLVGLQQAMLVVPAMYLASGLLFKVAEGLYGDEMSVKAAAAAGRRAELDKQQQQQQGSQGAEGLLAQAQPAAA
jgi:hypothetical protein